MIVSTAQGRLEALERDGLVHVRGVPYAAPPVGPRRFRPPEPPEPWDGVRDATAFGPPSWQRAGGITEILGDPTHDPSEDCLTLNVTTPACDDGARPVLVWIHGGGFVNGTAATPWYDGSRFAATGDVVVVSVNYRLGALGFLWLGDLDPSFRASGLNGILDQVAALRWIHDNIAAFGGDPDQVTIFGESAGAMSVCTLLAVPSARGLFRRAIAQSGAASNSFTPELAAEITSTVMARLGVTDLEGVLEAAPEALVSAGGAVTAELFADPGRIAGPTGIALAMAFQPVVDGEWLPVDPLTAAATGRAADVELLIGTNADEWNLFRLMSPSALDRERLLGRLDRIFGDGHRIHDTYAATRPDAGPADLWSAVLTDGTFRIPAERLLEARAAGTAASWSYRFTWPTPAFGGHIGSCHALEIPFVFDALHRSGAQLFLGGEPDDDMRDLARAMQDAWVAFARHGDPGHDGLPGWPQWDPIGRSTMRFDTERELLADPGRAERELWDGRP